MLPLAADSSLFVIISIVSHCFSHRADQLNLNRKFMFKAKAGRFEREEVLHIRVLKQHVYIKLDFMQPENQVAEWRFIQTGTLFL